MSGAMGAPHAILQGLQSYLRVQLEDPGLDVTAVEPIPEGHSGFTYFVTALHGGEVVRYVLRLPPPGARIAGPADIPRQGRVMAALSEQGIPVPRIIGNVAEPILDGRPFCLMERVDGVRIEKILETTTPEAVAREAVAVLKRMQAVPVESTGLGAENPVSLAEEMMRWAWLMQRAPEDLTGRAPALGELLAARQPAEPATGLVHGDYHYGNMLFRRRDDGTPEIVAIVDWEIAELGAPMLDLGCLCVVAQRNAADPDAPNPGGGMDLDIGAVIDLYGADPGESRWYLALSCYKYAAIFGYNLMLHRRGKRPDPMYEKLTGVIQALIENGITLAEEA